MNNEALIRYWAILNWKSMCNDQAYGDDFSTAYEVAMKDWKYKPINENLCMAYSCDLGWFMFHAKNGEMVKCDECGEMSGLNIDKE